MTTPRPTAPTVAPSHLQLPPGPWPSLLDGLCAHFPQISRARWLDRFERGRVQDRQGRPLQPAHAWRAGFELRYFREVACEPVIDGIETVLHEDDELLVADKPHFLPVVPAGAFVTQTLLARLVARTGNPDLVPLHRLDRLTAGVVLFSKRPATRDAYQRLFRERRIEKVYEALAPALPGTAFPREYRSRVVPGEPFFRMQEAPGEPNSLTRMAVIDDRGAIWRYQLRPVTGRKHQLRLHMASIGAPILGDDLYPCLRQGPGEGGMPLQLLAAQLRFVDPVSGQCHAFRTCLHLDPAVS